MSRTKIFRVHKHGQEPQIVRHVISDRAEQFEASQNDVPLVTPTEQDAAAIAERRRKAAADASRSKWNAEQRRLADRRSHWKKS